MTNQGRSASGSTPWGKRLLVGVGVHLVVDAISKATCPKCQGRAWLEFCPACKTIVWPKRRWPWAS